jgi:hypothetical protein
MKEKIITQGLSLIPSGMEGSWRWFVNRYNVTEKTDYRDVVESFYQDMN